MGSVSGKFENNDKILTKNDIMKDSLFNLSNIDDEQVIQSQKKYKNWWDIFVISKDATLYSIF